MDIFIQKKSSIKQIVIARGDMLGDVVLTAGIIAPLKKTFPKAKLTFLVQPSFVELFERHPDVDSCFPDTMPYTFSIWSLDHWKHFFKLFKIVRSLKCDLFIGAWYRPRYAWLSFLARIPNRVGHGFYWTCRRLYNFLSDFDPSDFTIHHFEWVSYLIQAIGVEDSDRRLSLPINDTYFQTLKHNYDYLNKPYICLHVDAGNPQKMMMPEVYVSLVDYLLTLNKIIVLFGREVDGIVKQHVLEKYPDHPNVKSIVGDLSVADLIPFIKGCDLYVGTDSGPAHIAAAVGAKSVIAFVNRCQNPLEWAPWRSKNRLVFSIHPCIDLCQDTLCKKITCRETLTIESFKKEIDQLNQINVIPSEEDQKLYWLKTCVVIGILRDGDEAYQAYCNSIKEMGFRVKYIESDTKLVLNKGKITYSDIKNFFIRYNRTMVVFPDKKRPLLFYLARIVASNYISFFPHFYSFSEFNDTFLVSQK